MKFRAHSVALALLALPPLGCHRSEAAPELKIYCAASFTDVAKDLALEFDADPFSIIPGPSNALARQLEDGAPGDLFITASPRWLEWLERLEDTQGIRRHIASNQVVCIAPADSPLATAKPGDAQALLAALAADDKVAIATEGVPVGDFARQALKALEVLEPLEKRLVGLRDARAVLRAVEAGEVAAGFAYHTDTLAGDVTELFTFAPNLHDEAVIVGVTLLGSPHSARALQLLKDMQSPKARQLLKRAGFQPYADPEDDR